MKEKTQIIVKQGVKKKIAISLGVTYPTISTALSMDYFTGLHLKIRKMAVENGGVEVVVK